MKACHKECFYSTCCDISACTFTNPELCEGYADFCSNLSELNIADATTGDSLLADKEETEDGTSVFIGEGSEEGDPDHPASGFSQKIFDRVSQVCSQQALAEPGGISACNIACRPAMCCFYSEKKGGQSDENHLGGSATATCISNKSDEWCSSYSPCQLLLHMDDEDLEDGIISSKELSRLLTKLVSSRKRAKSTLVNKFVVLESAVLMKQCRARAAWIVPCISLANNRIIHS